MKACRMSKMHSTWRIEILFLREKQRNKKIRKFLLMDLKNLNFLKCWDKSGKHQENKFASRNSFSANCDVKFYRSFSKCLFNWKVGVKSKNISIRFEIQIKVIMSSCFKLLFKSSKEILMNCCCGKRGNSLKFELCFHESNQK